MTDFFGDVVDIDVGIGHALSLLKKSAISDIFQDIVAFYLKMVLDENDFEIILEYQYNKIQPDILIKYKEQNLFAIEIKTTIGWERKALNNNGEGFRKRIDSISKTFQIPSENVVYIFLNPWNVNKKFTRKYLDIDDTWIPKPLPDDFPYNIIRPLLTYEDPFYSQQDFGFSPNNVTESTIEDLAQKENLIIIPLEDTIKQIIEVSKKVQI